MVEVEPIGGNQELRIGVGLRILVDFGIKLKLGKFWAKVSEKRCSKLRFSTTKLTCIKLLHKKNNFLT